MSAQFCMGRAVTFVQRAENTFFRPARFLLVIVALQGLIEAKPQWDPVSPDELAEDKPKVEASAGVEILSYQLEIDDRERDRREIRRKIRFKIYDPTRATKATRIAMLASNGSDYEDADKLEIAARLTAPDGSVRTFGKADLRTRKIFEEGKANGFLGALGFMSDQNWGAQEKFLAVTGVTKGAILDVWERQPDALNENYLVLSIQRREIPIRHFDFANRFNYDPHVLRRIYVLNPNGGTMKSDQKGGLITFHADNLAALPNEPLSPPESYYSLTIVQASEQMSIGLAHIHALHVPEPDDVPPERGPWAFFSTTLDYYDADIGYVTKAVKEKASELTAGAASEHEKARRIYEYVQSLYQHFRKRADLENWYTRYIESVDELIKLDKIDSTIIRPQDFHFLFLALIRAAGMECHTACHAHRTAFRFSPELVARNLINYRSIALKADGEWEVCTPCTDLPLPFGMRPCVIESQPALLALPQTQTFLNIPPLPAGKSVAETTGILELDLAGNLQGECVRTFTGHEAAEVRRRLDATGQEFWWKFTHSFFGLENSSAEARLISVEGQNAPDEPLRIRAFIRWPAYAALMQGRMIVTPSVFSEGTGPAVSATSRKTSVFFEYPKTTREAITIKLPAGYRTGSLPAPIENRTGAFSFALAMKYDANAGALAINRETTNEAVEIPVGDYPQALDWFSKVCATDQIAVVVRPIESKK